MVKTKVILYQPIGGSCTLGSANSFSAGGCFGTQGDRPVPTPSLAPQSHHHQHGRPIPAIHLMRLSSQTSGVVLEIAYFGSIGSAASMRWICALYRGILGRRMVIQHSPYRNSLLRSLSLSKVNSIRVCFLEIHLPVNSLCSTRPAIQQAIFAPSILSSLTRSMVLEID
jgi:hypothetical protein